MTQSQGVPVVCLHHTKTCLLQHQCIHGGGAIIEDAVRKMQKTSHSAEDQAGMKQEGPCKGASDPLFQADGGESQEASLREATAFRGPLPAYLMKPLRVSRMWRPKK